MDIVQVADLGEGMATGTNDTAVTTSIDHLPLTATGGKGAGGGGGSTNRKSIGKVFFEGKFQGNVRPNGEMGTFGEGGRGDETAAGSVVHEGLVGAAATMEQALICGRVLVRS